MGKRLGSWGELGGSGGVEFAKKWQEHGFYKVVLHRDPPWERRVHNFRRIEVDERAKDGPKKMILWFPFVCWEGDEYHRNRRKFKDEPDRRPSAQHCPGCRTVEHVEARDDLADDASLFSFVAGRERRDIIKVDFLGLGDTKHSFQDNFTAKTEYIIPHIPIDDPSQVIVTNEKWSMGRSIKKRIVDDKKIYGAEDGDPAKTPIGYLFEFDKEQLRYGCSRLDKFEADEEMKKLWAGPCPDAGRYVMPGHPGRLLDQMRGGSELAKCELPLKEIFGPALARWKDDEENDPALVFPPSDGDGDGAPSEPAGKPAGKAGASRSKPKPSSSGESAAKGPKGAKGTKAGAESASEPAAEPEKQQRKTRTTKPKKQAAPPEPEPEVYECPDCKKDWPENEPACPNCGAVAEDAPADFKGEEETAAPPADNGKPRKGDIPW